MPMFYTTHMQARACTHTYVHACAHMRAHTHMHTHGTCYQWHLVLTVIGGRSNKAWWAFSLSLSCTQKDKWT